MSFGNGDAYFARSLWDGLVILSRVKNLAHIDAAYRDWSSVILKFSCCVIRDCKNQCNCPSNLHSNLAHIVFSKVSRISVDDAK